MPVVHIKNTAASSTYYTNVCLQPSAARDNPHHADQRISATDTACMPTNCRTRAERSTKKGPEMRGLQAAQQTTMVAYDERSSSGTSYATTSMTTSIPEPCVHVLLSMRGPQQVA